MKIIQIIPSFDIGGAEIMCETLINELFKKDNEVIIISLYDFHSVITERIENTGLKIIYLHKKNGFDISIIKNIKNIINTEKPDVVHTHQYALKYVVLGGLKSDVKYIHTIHSVAEKENGRLDRMANRLAFRYFKVTAVAISEEIKETINKEYKIKNIPVVYNGVNFDKITEKKSYYIKDRFRIVNVAAFRKEKNHKCLADGFKLFIKKYPDSILEFVGGGVEFYEIQKYVSEIGIDNKVVFWGNRDDVCKIIADADVFILPSFYEGMPLSLIEAMKTGLPIIASNVGGIKDMIDDNCCILIKPDCIEISKALERYYLNPELRKTHGEKVKKLSEKFSSCAMTEKYMKIYKNRS